VGLVAGELVLVEDLERLLLHLGRKTHLDGFFFFIRRHGQASVRVLRDAQVGACGGHGHD
jgi:hypothetical protein